MTKDITVDVSEWERFADAAKNNREAFDKHAKNAMDGSLDYLLQLITLKYMGQQHGENPAHGVNAGHLRGSFATDIYGSGLDIVGTVSSSLPYGLPVETGRRPGRMPPVEAIKLWVIRKMGLGGKEADSAAYLIARAIGRRGTDGVHMVEKSYREALGTDVIEKAWHYELERYIEELLP